MEEYSGAYMRLLHNVFRVARANFVLASDTPTTPVQADRDVTLWCAWLTLYSTNLAVLLQLAIVPQYPSTG